MNSDRETTQTSGMQQLADCCGAVMVVSRERRRGVRCCGIALGTRLQPGEAQRLSDCLQALAHPVRLQVLDLLARNQGQVCVCDLESALPVKQPTISHHLKLLCGAGLVAHERRGIWSYYFVRREALADLTSLIVAQLTAWSVSGPTPEATGSEANASPVAVSIGRAKRGELSAILSLLERCGLATAGLTDHLETTLVARAENRVVGSAALELYGSSALLRSVAVEEALRGCGIGQRLTSQALELAKRRGVAKVYLLTDTAMAFYPRFGFRPIPRDQAAPAVQRSVEFTGACPTTAQAMELLIERPRGERP